MPKRVPPMFLGQPSPCLARMQRMNFEAIATHVDALESERGLIRCRLERVRKVNADLLHEPRQRRALRQMSRLSALIDEGRRLLDAKASGKAA